MSLRQYRPRRDLRRGISPVRARILWGALTLAIFLQILYPLVHGGLLRGLTLAIVYAGALAMSIHALYSYGTRYFLTYVAITLIFAFTVEQIGIRTGWPFGNYHYDSTLGLALAGVPLVVPCAWLMMAHPILIIGRRVATTWVAIFGGIALMSWDFFLDSQMVAAGRWHWESVKPALPLEPTIPLSNAAGWLFAGMGLVGLLHWALPKERRKVGANFTAVHIFLAWTYFSGVVGNIFFFDRPGTALLGGAFLGGVLGSYFVSMRFGRPEYF